MKENSMSNLNDRHGNLILEDEKNIVLDHSYDGILELDNQLPSWWMMSFWGGIFFAIFYFILFQIMDAPSLRDEYEKDLAKLREIQEIEAKNVGNFNVEQYRAFVAGEDAKILGAQVYADNCFACHVEGGGGDIGPNLTDKYWLHVKPQEPESTYRFIVKGFEENGMPAWGEMLSKDEIMAVTDHIISLYGTTPPKAKGPQGEFIE